MQGRFESSWFLSSGLFSVLELSWSESFDSQISLLGEEHCETVSSSSENSEVEIVYGLKLLRHFSAILSHSHPRAHSQLQYAQSAAVKTLKHMLFHNLWIEFGMAIARHLKPRHPRSTKFRLLNWMISNLFYQLSLAQQKHDETGLRPSPPPPSLCLKLWVYDELYCILLCILLL